MTTAVAINATSYPFLFFIPEVHDWDFLNQLIEDAYEDALDSTDSLLGIPTAIDIAGQVEGYYVDVLIEKSIHHDDVHWGCSIRPAIMEAIENDTLDLYKDEMWDIIQSAGISFNDGFGELLLMDIQLLLDIKKLVYCTYEGTSETLTDEMKYEGIQRIGQFFCDEERIVNVPVCEVW